MKYLTVGLAYTVTVGITVIFLVISFIEIMNLFNELKEWLENIKNQAKIKKILKHNKLIEKECCRNFQIMEFDGKVYICYESIPVVRVEDLKKSPTEILEQSREDFVKFHNKFEMP